MKSKIVFTPSSSVVAQITRLPDMKMDEIKSLWKKLYQKDPPTHIRTYLERRLAYKMEELEFKKNHKNLADKNQQRIKTLINTLQQQRKSSYPASMPGTVLTRIYNDVEHRILVLPDGQFEFNGCVYKSLSRIAREITGTRWSGPLFFGLKNVRNGNKSKKGGK